MAKILIVDDEIMIREVVKEYAKINDILVDEASDGLEAVEKVKNDKYDVIVLDIMMPKLDGFGVIKQIRQFSDVAIIMLSARQEEYDKVFCFENGVDDYVTKPFSPKELMARIKRLIERNSKIVSNIIKIDDLVIDKLGRVITIDGERINMTPKEIDLLIYLVENKNIAMSRENLLNAIWKYDYLGDDRTVDTHIKMLRKSIGPKYRSKIVTVRGMGYKFEA